MSRPNHMTLRMRHALYVGLGALVFAVTSVAEAAAISPDAIIREAYAVSIRQVAPNVRHAPPPWGAPHRDKFMSKSLAVLFSREELYRRETGKIGNLDVDPFIGRRRHVERLRVRVTEKPANGRALVTASFGDPEQPVSVRFPMVEESGAWRIDNIVNRFEGRDYPVREALSQPYECGSFMKKPCRKP